MRTARPLRLFGLFAAHILIAGCALALSGCGQQPTSPVAAGDSTSPAPLNLTDPTEPRRCPHGTFEGWWIKDDGFEDRGRIEAAWLGPKGDTLGMMTGVFAYDTAAQELRWRAMVSGINLPVVLLEMSGRWMFTDPRMCPMCGTSEGAMSGVWRDARSNHRGRLIGEWGDMALPFPERKMPLSGRWRAACQSISLSQVAEQPH